METLSQLDDQLSLVLHHLDSDDEDDREVAEALLADLLPQLDKKIDSYMGVMTHYADKISNIDREITRLQARKASEQNKQDYLKSVLQNWMELRMNELGDRGKKVEGNLYKVSLVNNGGKLPLKVNEDFDIADIPEDFKMTKTSISLNMEKIREYLDASSEKQLTSPNGSIIATLLPRGKHLRIS